MLYPSALLVAYQVEYIFLVAVFKANEVFLGFVGVREVLSLSLEILFVAGIFSVFVFHPEGLAVIGHGFINGDVAPAFGGYVIAEPLVKEFMGDNGFPGIAIGELAAVLVSAFLVKGGSGVFHGAAYVVAANDLVVFLPGVLYAQFIGKEFDHFRCKSEYASCVRSLLRFYVITYFFAFITVFDDFEIAHTHEKKIGSVGQVHFPVIGAGAICIFLLADE